MGRVRLSTCCSLCGGLCGFDVFVLQWIYSQIKLRCCGVMWWKPACIQLLRYMGASKNRGTPKWMVYNGKPF